MAKQSKFSISFLFQRDVYGSLVFFLFLLCSPAFGQAPPVTINPLPLRDSAQVSFTVFQGTPADSAGTGRLFKYETRDHRYAIIVDPNKIGLVPRYDAFYFEVLVSVQGAPIPSWYRYDVRADLSGKFPDTIADVPIKIGAYPDESLVNVKLPIHCESYDDSLGLADPSLSDRSLLRVELSNPTGPSITVRNTLTTLAIHVTKVEAHPVNCPGCWKDQINKPLDVLIPASSTAQISLNLPPRSFSAMFKSAFILKEELPHDAVEAQLTYNVDQGGSTKIKPIQVRIRFSPTLWQLTLSVLIGAVVGIILKILVATRKKKDQFTQEDPRIKKGKVRWKEVIRLWVKTLVIGIFFAAVAEFIAVSIASLDSKLILFNRDLDPRQCVPAVLLAMVVTGGRPVIQWIQTLIRILGGAANGDDGRNRPEPAVRP
jgi:hypothetical protein